MSWKRIIQHNNIMESIRQKGQVKRSDNKKKFDTITLFFGFHSGEFKFEISV